VRYLGAWTELALPGVDDGESSARALSQALLGEVIWIIVQTTASVIGVTHFESGRVVRRLEFADGSWQRVEGQPQPWEAQLFSSAELDAAKEVGSPEDDAELERAFANRTLEAGSGLPWPREWETLRYALGVSEAEWQVTRASAPLGSVEGRATSMLTHCARGMLALGMAALLGRLWRPSSGFAALATVSLLVAFCAGYLRRRALGRWFL